MLYVGVNLSSTSFQAVILSHSFALLDSKNFYLKDLPSNSLFLNWIDPFKQHQFEPSIFFFDQLQFNSSTSAHHFFSNINHPDKILFIPHRKIPDILCVIKDWLMTQDIPTFFDQPEYFLASSFRLFDLNQDDLPLP
ncbi:MAG: hypothetical protein AB1422_04285 [bacterium]